MTYETITIINIAAIILSPVIAVCIGERLRKRNYQKQQRDNLVRKIISRGYQLSPTYRGEKKEILEALNEIKYWYYDDEKIKKATFELMDKMSANQGAQDPFIELIKAVAFKEGHLLSEQEIERVFSMK